MMEYKGYQAQVGYDAESQAFHGQVINLRDVITFRATSVAGLHRELAASIEDYLEFCSSRGEEPERPFSGRLVVRMPPDLHREATLAAARDGVSLNSWIVEQVAGAMTTGKHRSK